VPASAQTGFVGHLRRPGLRPEQTLTARLR
jgi:hypothetical protein